MTRDPSYPPPEGGRREVRLKPPVAAGGPRILLRRLREIMARQAVRKRASTSSSLSSPRTWWRRFVRSTCGAPARRWSCSRHRRPQSRRGPSHADEGRRGFGGPSRRDRGSGEPENAPSHPHFSYRPETGEDPYHSFLGVPIVRGGQVFGNAPAMHRNSRADERAVPHEVHAANDVLLFAGKDAEVFGQVFGQADAAQFPAP